MALFGVGTFKEVTELDYLTSLVGPNLILLHILEGDLDMKTGTRDVTGYRKGVRKESPSVSHTF